MICYNCSAETLKYDKDQDAYVCLSCGHIYPKEYWFISHSHLDIEKVRFIRDVIEEVFFYEPILFFLKCLSDEREINDLLQREIAERIWFVYCQSENAENSKYVQGERAYLDTLIAHGKKINKIQIELDKFELWDPQCKQYIRDQVFRGIRKSKLYLAHVRADDGCVMSLRERLLSNGYNTFQLMQPQSFFNFGLSVEDAIKSHSYDDGAVLAFISERAFDADYFLSELNFAIENRAVIIPVFIDDGNVDVKKQREHLIEVLPALHKSNYVVCDAKDVGGAYKKLEQALKYFYIKA